MARSSLRVRRATEDDLDALLDLGTQLRDQVFAVETRPRTDTALRARYLEALSDRRRHVFVVVDDARAQDDPGGRDEVLGMALLAVAPASALLDHDAVHVHHAVVADRHRRRGAGRALVAAAAVFAEERGLEQIVVSVHPSSRDANRFFARLGFAPIAVRRAAPLAVVRRHLAARELRTVDHVVRRRRTGRDLHLLPGDGLALPVRRERRA